ncbi:hypothetical protein OA006_00610 [Prochlorococcus sp. AH-736-D21]|nr:hypothetical protein [Prochlorococcus sp. AH-736-D21]
MKFFAHSINNLNDLNDLDEEFGVEIDVRDYGGKLVIGHDPLMLNYQDLEDYLKLINGRSIIANIKSERTEKAFLDLLSKYSPYSEYFFLDSSFSMIANFGKDLNFASRFSEYESLNTSINLIEGSLVNWIWVDTFSIFPINIGNFELFNSLEVKKCLTSPDLTGRSLEIENYAKIINDLDIRFDAICCKKNNIERWKSLL